MTRARTRAAVLRAARLGGAMAMVVGCYNPHVTPGGLKCSATGKACPDGFVCESGSCVSVTSVDAASGSGGEASSSGGAPGTGGRPGTGGASGGAGVGGHGGGATGGGGAAGTGGSAGAGGMCANPIAPLCQSPTGLGMCDPVCQTGCGCGLTCGVAGGGTTCTGRTGTKTLNAVCRPEADDCAPGFVCLQESCGTNLGRCYRYCRDASVCGNAVCSTPIELPNGSASSQRACSLGDITCDPIAGTGCPDPALKCYVTGPSHTTCDCPNSPTGGAGAACTSYNDCATGLACLTVSGRQSCYTLCRSTADCPTCTLLAAGSVGFCAS